LDGATAVTQRGHQTRGEIARRRQQSVNPPPRARTFYDFSTLLPPSRGDKRCCAITPKPSSRWNVPHTILLRLLFKRRRRLNSNLSIADFNRRRFGCCCCRRWADLSSVLLGGRSELLSARPDRCKLRRGQMLARFGGHRR